MQPLNESISPLLKDLTEPANKNISAEAIAGAFELLFENRVSDVQCASLLTALHASGRDREPLVIAKCAQGMRAAAAQVDRRALQKVVRSRGRKEGSYKGGLCDIVGKSSC